MICGCFKCHWINNSAIITWKIPELVFKLSALISSLVQQLHMAVFGLYLTNIPKVLNFSTKMPWKINQQIFFYTCWWNQHTNQGLLQKEKLDINGEKSAEISILVQKTVTKRWLKIRIHISYTLQLFCCFFIIMFILCYWNNQKTRIAFTGS